MGKRMNFFDYLTAVLMIVGALNWGFFAFGINLVESLQFQWLIKTVYILVGISGAYWIYRMTTLVRK